MAPFTAILLLVSRLWLPASFGEAPEYQPVPTAEGQTEELTLVLVGDLMAHIDMVQDAWDGESYDFTPFFRFVEPLLSLADIAMGNLETTLAGPDGAFQKVPGTYFQGYQGYPFFNTPDAYADALADAGFDILSVANNHSLDSGMEGAIRTHEIVEKAGMIPVGTQPAGEDGTVYLERKGMKLAFLSFTYSTNRFTVIEEQGWRVNSLNMYRDELIRDMLDQVRKAADQSEFTLVMIHFGWSYVNRPDDWQVYLTDQLLQAGADMVAGDHPHVLQPMSYRTNGDGERAFQIYSLSNFISHQTRSGNPPVSKDAGVILKLRLREPEPGRVEIAGVEYLPTWVRMNDGSFTVIPLDLAMRYPRYFAITPEDLLRMNSLKVESPRILGGESRVQYPYRSFPEP